MNKNHVKISFHPSQNIKDQENTQQQMLLSM